MKEVRTDREVVRTGGKTTRLLLKHAQGLRRREATYLEPNVPCLDAGALITARAHKRVPNENMIAGRKGNNCRHQNSRQHRLDHDDCASFALVQGLMLIPLCMKRAPCQVPSRVALLGSSTRHHFMNELNSI